MQVIEKALNKYKNLSKVAKASLWFVLCGFLQRGISVITTPIFTRLLDTSEYGTYSVFNSWLEIITIFATLKLGYGVYVQGLVKYSDDQDKFSSSLLGLATAWWAACFGIYLLTHNFWNKLLGLSSYMMICMFIMMIATVSYNFWAARKRNEYSYVQLVRLTLIISVLKPVTGIIAVLLAENAKVEARITTLAAVELLVYAVLYFQIMSKGKAFFNKYYWKYAFSFNLPLVPHFLSQVILNHSDRIMIQRLCGSSDAGIYSLAYSLAMVLTMLNTSIQNAMRPWVFQRLKANQGQEIQDTAAGALIVVALCNLTLIAFAPEVVAVFSPSSYQGAVALVPPVTMGVFFAFMYNLFVDVEMYYEKTKSIMAVALICAVLNIVANFIFIGMYGYGAAAYTTLASYALMAILHYISMRRVMKKSGVRRNVYDIKIFVVISIAFVMLGAVLALLADYLVIRIIIVLVGVLCAYIMRDKLKVTFALLKNRRKK